MSIILGVLNEGLIYALMALGVYITYTILDFPAAFLPESTWRLQPPPLIGHRLYTE